MTRERDKLEMWERAVEQGLATVRGDEHEWLPGAGPQDVDWTCEREDDIEHEGNSGHPEVLARLCDAIFEGLHQTGQAETGNAFRGDYLRAARDGADLSLVHPRFTLWILDGLPKTDREDVTTAIKQVRDLFERWVETCEQPDESAARSAAESAESAALAALAAESAAWSAAWSSRSAESAALAASAASAAGSSRSARAMFWLAARDEMIRLVSEAPVIMEDTTDE